jgi:hypothetical protein
MSTNESHTYSKNQKASPPVHDPEPGKEGGHVPRPPSTQTDAKRHHRDDKSRDKPNAAAQAALDNAGKPKRPPLTDAEVEVRWEQEQEEKFQQDVARCGALLAERRARRAKNNGHTPPEKATGPYRQAEALEAQQHCVVQPTKPDDGAGIGPCSVVTKEQFFKRLSALEHMLEVVPHYHPKAAKKVAIMAHNEVRRLRLDVGQDDLAQVNRTLLGAKLLNHRRTRFFVTYAEHGIRLSALLFLVASHTRRRWRAGKRGRQAGWRNTAEWLGAQIGISGRHYGAQLN